MPGDPPVEPLLTAADLAAYLSVPLETVYRWNHRGRGPRPLKAGRAVRYRLEDVQAWLERDANAVAS